MVNWTKWLGGMGSEGGGERTTGGVRGGLQWFSYNLYSLSLFSLLPDTLSSREGPSHSLCRHHTRCVRTQTGELNIAAMIEQEVCVVLGEAFLYKADECSFLHTAGPMCTMCEKYPVHPCCFGLLL